MAGTITGNSASLDGGGVYTVNNATTVVASGFTVAFGGNTAQTAADPGTANPYDSGTNNVGGAAVTGLSIPGLGNAYNNYDINYAGPAVTLYTVTVQDDGNGTASADKTINIVAGETVTLDAVPGSGYDFSFWDVISGGAVITGTSGGTGTSGAATGTGDTFVMPAADVVVAAHFAQPVIAPPATFSVTVENNGLGEATADLLTGVTPGTIVTLSTSCGKYHYFTRWEVISGGVVLADAGIEYVGKRQIVRATFTMPAEDVIIKAYFGYNNDDPDPPYYPTPKPVAAETNDTDTAAEPVPALPVDTAPVPDPSAGDAAAAAGTDSGADTANQGGATFQPGTPDVPPIPVNPGATLVPRDGGYYEVGSDGTYLGKWHYDPNQGAWIYEALPPSAHVPQTGDDDLMTLLLFIIGIAMMGMIFAGMGLTAALKRE